MERFKKMYIGVVKTPGSTHYVQEWFSMQGFFSIKVTPLGANKVLLEEMEEGIIPALISDAAEWIYEKFEDIRGWSQAEGDDERLVWVRCHGVPVHAWNEEFFKSLVRKFGELVAIDEDTRKKLSMDVARLMIRTKGYDVFNMVVEAKINGSMHHIKVIEEWCGPLRWFSSSKVNVSEEDTYTSEAGSEDEDDDVPPFFMAEDDDLGSSSDEEEVEKSKQFKNMEDNEELSFVQETLDILKKKKAHHQGE